MAENATKVIYDICGGTGAWSKPYKEAGYTVRVLTLPTDIRLVKFPDEPVHGILAAPPCTMFASSGARWKRTEKEIIEALSIVDACLRFVLLCDPIWWALENPVGILKRYIGPPKMYFQPYEFGDPYTKKTSLWGDFNIPQKNIVQSIGYFPGWKNYGGKSAKTKTMRSITPPGFAKAFFEANK